MVVWLCDRVKATAPRPALRAGSDSEVGLPAPPSIFNQYIDHCFVLLSFDRETRFQENDRAMVLFWGRISCRKSSKTLLALHLQRLSRFNYQSIHSGNPNVGVQKMWKVFLSGIIDFPYSMLITGLRKKSAIMF